MPPSDDDDDDEDVEEGGEESVEAEAPSQVEVQGLAVRLALESDPSSRRGRENEAVGTPKKRLMVQARKATTIILEGAPEAVTCLIFCQRAQHSVMLRFLCAQQKGTVLTILGNNYHERCPWGVVFLSC